MPHYVGTVDSAMKPAELFDYMAEFTNAERWDPGTKSAKRLDSGAIGEGSRFELVVEVMGRETTLVYEVVEYQRPARVALRAESNTASLLDTMTVAAADGHSVLTYDARLELKGARRLFSPLMAVVFRRLCERGRAGLVRELNRG